MTASTVVRLCSVGLAADVAVTAAVMSGLALFERVHAKYVFISGRGLFGVPGVASSFVWDGSLVLGTECCYGSLVLGEVGLSGGCDGVGGHGS